MTAIAIANDLPAARRQNDRLARLSGRQQLLLVIASASLLPLRRITVLATLVLVSLVGVASVRAQPAANSVKRDAPTPEQDRASLVAAIQKRLPGVPVDEWSQGGASFTPGVAVTPLGGAHATNVNDILAIGKKQFNRKFKNGKSMAVCFPNGGRRAAVNYPQFDAVAGRVVTLEMAINQCLPQQGEAPIGVGETLKMGALSAYIRSLSVGQKLNVRVPAVAGENSARDRYLAGRGWFTRRIGEQDLACASCHVLQAGKIVDGVGISPAVGQVLAWPRVEPGGGVRSLQHQFQRCMARVGAEPLPLHSAPFNDLEYFLSAISNGLTIRPAISTQ